jgi:hypothetical protein
MRRWIVLAFALLLPMKAGAVVTWDELHALVRAGDIAPVEDALQAAVDADKLSSGEPDEQRKLFALFTNSAPDIETFLGRWQAERPASALAMTAMGWHLWKRGWNALGGVGAPLPEAEAVLATDHAAALDLAVRAVAADPHLIAASDLMLRLTITLGNPEIAPAEMERVMALHPNRGSLMRIFGAYSRQVADRRLLVTTLCDRYAPLIRSIPDYDAMTCSVDAAYRGGVLYGEDGTEARQLLQLTSSPVLDYARLQDAVWGFGPPKQRVRILEAQKGERALDTDEARALDAARAEAAGPGVLILQDEWKIALAAAVDQRRVAADLDPYDPVTVTRYVATLQDASNHLGLALQRDEVIARLQTLLGRVPFAAEAWRDLADLTIGETDPVAVSLDTLEQVEPYYINAVVYSNYRADIVASLASGKYWAIVDPSDITQTRNMTVLSAAERGRLDEVVNCPMMRQLKILMLVCSNQEIDIDTCGGFSGGTVPIESRLQKVNGDGGCKQEVNRAMEDLAYSPIAIDFPPAP